MGFLSPGALPTPLARGLRPQAPSLWAAVLTPDLPAQANAPPNVTGEPLGPAFPPPLLTQLLGLAPAPPQRPTPAPASAQTSRAGPVWGLSALSPLPGLGRPRPLLGSREPSPSD